MDDSETFYLYHDQLDVLNDITLRNAVCADLDYSEYRNGTASMQAYTGHAYDSMYAMAMIMDRYMTSKQSQHQEIPEVPVMSELLEQAFGVSFEGATGQVSFDEGSTDFR